MSPRMPRMLVFWWCLVAPLHQLCRCSPGECVCAYLYTLYGNLACMSVCFRCWFYVSLVDNTVALLSQINPHKSPVTLC